MTLSLLSAMLSWIIRLTIKGPLKEAAFFALWVFSTQWRKAGTVLRKRTEIGVKMKEM